MKNVTKLFCCLLIATSAFAQGNKTSFSNLQKTLDNKGVPVYSLNGKLFTGTTYDEYDIEQIYREVVIANGLIQKESGWYFDGKKEREFNFKNGVLHGKLLLYHRSGNVYLEENYRNGLTEGKQYRYNCDGSLQCQWDCAGGMTLMKLDYEVKKCRDNCKVDNC